MSSFGLDAGLLRVIDGVNDIALSSGFNVAYTVPSGTYARVFLFGLRPTTVSGGASVSVFCRVNPTNYPGGGSLYSTTGFSPSGSSTAMTPLRLRDSVLNEQVSEQGVILSEGDEIIINVTGSLTLANLAVKIFEFSAPGGVVQL